MMPLEATPERTVSPSLFSTQWLRRARVCLVAGALLLLVACSSTPVQPGYHRVERGDTLYSIARKHRRSVQDLVRWNRLSNPNRIAVGQLLRVVPPAGVATTGSRAKAAPPKTASAGASKPTNTQRAKPARAPARTPASPPRPDPAPPKRIGLVWPADGRVIRQFNGSSSKGIAIAGSAGAPVRAAAGGTVAYAGNRLRGYGNLVILKHASNYITIYAHNRRLLVAEGQSVRQGQTIAEMGDTDTNQVQLYFELRHDGRPTNPLRMLPAR